MLIEDGIITHVGTNEDILSFKTPKTKLFDLEERTVIPGLIDSHLHLYKTGIMLKSVNLRNSTSSNDVIQSIKEYLTTNPDTQILMGHGWNQENFTYKQLLTKHDLDQLEAHIPIILYRVCGHLLVANTKALELANITPQTKFENNGLIDFENGLFYEDAIGLLIQSLPEPTLEELKNTIKETIKYANSLGLTSLHTDDFIGNSFTNYPKVIQSYSELDKENSLNARIYQQMLLPTKKTLQHFLNNNFLDNVGSN